PLQQTFSKAKAGTSGTDGVRGSVRIYTTQSDFQRYDTRVAPKAKWARTGTLVGTDSSLGTAFDGDATAIVQAWLTANGLPTTLRAGDELTVTHVGGEKVATGVWTGTYWQNPGVVIDGNLLVGGTVSALAIDAVYSLSVQGEAITLPVGAVTSTDTTITATSAATAQVVLNGPHGVAYQIPAAQAGSQ
ncbi:MAG TPA: hypothetical protein PLV68_21695, partial [Ilumatobacteraceae bacterium]|nr:hypothetical protein [Ilumatobacteraceae bacterium]